MQKKLFKTLLLIAAIAIPLKLTSTVRVTLESNQAMNQLNSELDYQLLKNIQYIEYLDYFTIVIGAFAMFSIWKPKTKQTQNESNQ